MSTVDVEHGDARTGLVGDERPAPHMSRRMREFAAALNRASREYLAGQGVSPTAEYRLSVETCPIHGIRCARVTYGMLRDHVPWTQSDPRKVAAALLGTMMLPPPSAETP
jgi:hypothetical protein